MFPFTQPPGGQRSNGVHAFPPGLDQWLEHMEQVQLNMALEASQQQYEEESYKRRKEVDATALEEICLDLEDLANNKQCAICFEDQACGDTAIRLRCGHCFHRQCVVPWFRKSASCPVCRLDLSTDETPNDMSDRERAEREEFAKRLEERRKEKDARLEEQRRRMASLDDDNNKAKEVTATTQQPKEAQTETTQAETSTPPEIQDVEFASLAVSKLKKMILALGLENAARFAVEKKDLIKVLTDSTDVEELQKLSTTDLKHRLNALKVSNERTLSKESLATLVRIRSLECIHTLL